MDNPEKSTGLFTATKDTLTDKEKADLKRAFQTAYDNDSIMWQQVISFDNRFLTKQGIYDPKTGYLNEARLRDCTRNMMAEMFRKEGLQATGVWSASIHYNTDNIHVHVAATEPVSTRKKFEYKGEERPRGFLRPDTLKGMKSKVVNTFLDINRAYIDELVRKRIIAGKRNTLSADDYQMRKMFNRIYEKLPADKSKWFYAMNEIASLRPELDKMSMYYVRTYHEKDFTEYQRILLQQQDIYKEAYGQNSRYKNYASNQMDDLKKRLGNAILSEMKAYSRIEIKSMNRKEMQELNKMQISRAVSRLKNALYANFKQHRRNLLEYHQLTQELEQ